MVWAITISPQPSWYLERSVRNASVGVPNSAARRVAIVVSPALVAPWSTLRACDLRLASACERLEAGTFALRSSMAFVVTLMVGTGGGGGADGVCAITKAAQASAAAAPMKMGAMRFISGLLWFRQPCRCVSGRACGVSAHHGARKSRAARNFFVGGGLSRCRTQIVEMGPGAGSQELLNALPRDSR